MQVSNKTLYIHGFLGESNEIPFLQGLDLYQTMLMNDEETLNFLKRHYGEFENVVGYSMGGRFILNYFHSFFSSFKKIYLLSSHFGLSNVGDKNNRSKIADEISRQILKDNFLSYWNGLEIFQKDHDITQLQRDKIKYKNLFDRYRLEKQQCFRKEVEENQKIEVYLGEYDKKYRALYSGLFKKIHIVPGRGHRLNDTILIKEILNGDY